mmetsp:Transcript_38449/g.63016  ORF Transcript_38449/g.63016 Transcript_38449/m.63016 type:complete len:410 (-) Transcript_38449:78-1307(-)
MTPTEKHAQMSDEEHEHESEGTHESMPSLHTDGEEDDEEDDDDGDESMRKNDDENDDDDNEEKKETDDDAKNECFCDPFVRLICGVLCHPSTFANMNNGNAHESKQQSASDFYQLLFACFITKMSQLSLAFAMNTTGQYVQCNDWPTFMTNALNINTETTTHALQQQLYEEMLLFLRKCLLVYNLFFNQSMHDLLSVLWSASEHNDYDAVRDECDKICDCLHLPTIRTFVVDEWCKQNEYVLRCMTHLNTKYVTKLARLRRDKMNGFALVELPTNYSQLFQLAAETKCEKRGKPPLQSGLCLLCGQFLCIKCCEGTVIEHCQKCNHGIGVILYLQKSSIMLVWDKCATQYETVFIDKYGESDHGLWRGVQLKLNTQRYHELAMLVLHHLIPNKMTQIRRSRRDFLENDL